MAGDMTDADILSLLKSSLKCDNSEIKAREGLNLQEVTDENVLIWLEKEKEIIVFPKTVIQGLKNEGIIEKSSEKEINFIFQVLYFALHGVTFRYSFTMVVSHQGPKEIPHSLYKTLEMFSIIVQQQEQTGFNLYVYINVLINTPTLPRQKYCNEQGI